MKGCCKFLIVGLILGIFNGCFYQENADAKAGKETVKKTTGAGVQKLTEAQQLIRRKSAAASAVEGFRKAIENHADNYNFQAGDYYDYNFDGGEAEWNGAEATLKMLLEKGVQVSDLWYRAEDTSCSAPGSAYALAVMVPPRCIVRLEKRDPRMAELGFVQTQKDNLQIFCGYIVTRYTNSVDPK